MSPSQDFTIMHNDGTNWDPSFIIALPGFFNCRFQEFVHSLVICYLVIRYYPIILVNTRILVVIGFVVCRLLFELSTSGLALSALSLFLSPFSSTLSPDTIWKKYIQRSKRSKRMALVHP